MRHATVMYILYAILVISVATNAVQREMGHQQQEDCGLTCSTQFQSTSEADLPPLPLEEEEAPSHSADHTFAAFEDAEKHYYNKWCASPTWEDDPPSAAAAVDWAENVLSLVN